MAIIYYNEYIGDDDYGNPMYREGSYDDGSIDTSDDPAADADLAGGLLTPDALAAVLGKENIDYDAWMKDAMTPEAQAAVQKLISSNATPSAIGKILDAFKTNGKYDWAKIATAGAGLYTMLKGQDDTGGYNVPIPKLDAVTQQIEYNDPNRRPGSAGRQYTTDPRYVKEGDAAGLAAAQAASNAQKAGILAAYKPAAAPTLNPYAGQMAMKYNTPAATEAAPPAEKPVGLPAIPTSQQLMDPNYKIGMTSNSPPEDERGKTWDYASGGIAMAKGRYLDGDTDGMADKISTTIDGDQEAALSHGEFVIPADVVSHLGNGNSDAGAKKLYAMMDRIREARTGTKEQGKKINPDKFLAAASGGLAAAYAAGGSVQKFNTGGTPAPSGGIPLDTSKTSTLSPWAGDYVTNMLGKTQALTNAPQEFYKGPLTAGASDLQQQGFAGISDIAKGGFNPTTFTSGTFDANAANKYMNPYLMASLNPQMEEARRQSQITQQGNAAKMTGAGAFGGSRSALMDAETQRSLGANMSNIVGTGLNTAYDKAMAQFNAEQNRGLDTQKATEASRQYSADFGLKSVNDLMQAGKTQRDIEAEGIAADKRQFEEQQARPYTNLEFQRKMLEGLPIGASTTSVNQDTLSKLQTDISGLAALYQKLANLGIKAK